MHGHNLAFEDFVDEDLRAMDYPGRLRLVSYSRLLHGVERGDHRFEVKVNGGKHDSEINLRVMLS